jgi:hypothetical protein
MQKTSSAFWNGGANNQAMLPTIDFLVKQILGIVASQIETKRFFFC